MNPNRNLVQLRKIVVASGSFDYIDVDYEIDWIMLSTLEKVVNKKEEKAVGIIIEILELELPEEREEYVIYSVMEALGKIGGRKGEEILVEYALNEEENQDRSAAAMSVLERVGREYTAEKMHNVLENKMDHYVYLRQYAIELLRKVYHSRSIEVLEKTLEKTSIREERREENRIVRETVDRNNGKRNKSRAKRRKICKQISRL